MQFDECSPEFIITFGKEKGYSLKQIYQFEPSYIEWLIEFTEILIDPKKFEPIATLKPYIAEYERKGKSLVELMKMGHTGIKKHGVKSAIEHLENGGVFKQTSFKFSERTISILSEKNAGTYAIPKYISSLGESFTLVKKTKNEK